jgi:spore protease
MNRYERTDLACESTPIGIKEEIKDGVRISAKSYDDFEVIKTEILNSSGEKITGRKTGKYLTLCLGNIWIYDENTLKKLKHVLSCVLREIIEGHIKNVKNVLVAGLGNRFITADSLGPLTIDKMVATNHLKEEGKKVFNSTGKCSVSLIAPGVVGQTGIEAAEIIKQSAKCVNAECIIVIDALASKSTHRLSTTIQISDSGIQPGSGIGNSRKEISMSTMGIPVIAIGVPTVVSSSSIIYEALEMAGIYNITKELDEILSNGKSFFVSPKESDIIISSMSKLLSDAIAEALDNSK